MGIFDIIELKNHCQAIGEYVLYIDAYPDDRKQALIFITDHLKKMVSLLDRIEKSK